MTDRGEPADYRDAIVSGPPDVVLAALLGRLSLAAARQRGLRIEGDSQLFGRLQPVSDTG